MELKKGMKDGTAKKLISFGNVSTIEFQDTARICDDVLVDGNSQKTRHALDASVFDVDREEKVLRRKALQKVLEHVYPIQEVQVHAKQSGSNERTGRLPSRSP